MCTISRYSAPVKVPFENKGSSMSEKLGIGSALPNLTIDLVDGGTLDLPDGLDAKYRVILFYRGHW
jgi:hypothetical protein